MDAILFNFLRGSGNSFRIVSQIINTIDDGSHDHLQNTRHFVEHGITLESK